MSFHIKDICISCGACERICEEGAISYGPNSKYHIDPEKCISCGCCYRACSIDAIFLDEESRKIVNERGGLIDKVIIDEEKCIGCTLCKKVCKTYGIVGELKKPHFVEDDLCVRCGRCFDKCRKGAITLVRRSA